MIDKEKDNLLYRPDLKPYRHYESNAVIKPGNAADVPPLPIPETPNNKPLIDAREDLDELIDLIPDLPEPLHALIPTLRKLKRRVDVLIPEATNPPGTNPPGVFVPPTPRYVPPSINMITHIPQEENPALAQLPNLFPTSVNIELNIEYPRTLVQIVQDDYMRDQIEIIQDYIQQLQIIMRRYFQTMIASMKECGIDDMDMLDEEFDGEYVTIPEGQGLEHLRDYVCRAQVARDQMCRLFHKTHSADKTLMHMRSWQAAEKQRERYYGEKYKDSGEYAESHSNALLRESRASYDDNYKAAFSSFYKYLNSSLLMTNDILNLTSKMGQGKAMLMKSGVNIFAKDPSIEYFADVGGQYGAGTASNDAAIQKDIDKQSKNAEPNTHSASPNNDSTGETPEATDDQYKNDVDYLLARGYTKEQADEELAKLPQYKKRFDKATSSTTTTNNDDDDDEFAEGKQASQEQYENDIAYLESQGYSREDAKKELAKLPQYGVRLGGKKSNNIWDSFKEGLDKGGGNFKDIISGKQSVLEAATNVSSALGLKVHGHNVSDLLTGKDKVGGIFGDIVNAEIQGVSGTLADTSIFDATHPVGPENTVNGVRQASDSKYRRDLKALEDKGYTKEEADAELAKQPEYYARLGGQVTDAQYTNDYKYLIAQGYDDSSAKAQLSQLDKYKTRFSAVSNEDNSPINFDKNYRKELKAKEKEERKKEEAAYQAKKKAEEQKEMEKKKASAKEAAKNAYKVVTEEKSGNIPEKEPIKEAPKEDPIKEVPKTEPVKEVPKPETSTDILAKISSSSSSENDVKTYSTPSSYSTPKGKLKEPEKTENEPTVNKPVEQYKASDFIYNAVIDVYFSGQWTNDLANNVRGKLSAAGLKCIRGSLKVSYWHAVLTSKGAGNYTRFDQVVSAIRNAGLSVSEARDNARKEGNHINSSCYIKISV